MDSLDKKWERSFLKSSKKESSSLILHNDDVNSFEHVIESLCEICDHESLQAEQCAFITHFKGKCQIKRGSLEELRALKERLSVRNLLVTIDS